MSASQDKNVHDEFISTMRETGLENFATEVSGIIKNGTVPSLKSEDSKTKAKANDAGSASSFSNDKNSDGRKRRQSSSKEEEAEAKEESKGKKKRKNEEASPGKNQVDDSAKSNKGLRHFSMKVCKKVEEKGVTSYNEVADELVHEFLHLSPVEVGSTGKPTFDEKNIRRRVYDALNVLMAMDIVSKEKKEIRWKGLPTNAQHDRDVLEREQERLEMTIARKREHLGQLMEQQVTYHNLVKRNLEMETSDASFHASSSQGEEEEAYKSMKLDSTVNAEEGGVNTGEMGGGEGHHEREAPSTPGPSTTPLLYPETPIDILGATPGNDKGITATPLGWTEHGLIGMPVIDGGTLMTPGSGGNDAGHSVQQQYQHAMSTQQHTGRTTTSSSIIDDAQTKVALPFIVITTGVNTMVQCEMTESRNEVSFQFSDTFEINDDAEVLKRLGLHQASEEELKQMFSPKLLPYLPRSSYLPSTSSSSSSPTNV